MILNKLHGINSGNTRSRKKTNGDYINNINLKKKYIYIKNKNKK